ncbi:MAG TPA: ribokinase [Jiangellaceae bacterium]|nr:ribokinase [Jiangellaceae bacterium]
MTARSVVVVGSANADLVLDIDHRPGPGETILGSDVVTTPGGKGANQAVAAGKIGGDVAFIGCVGDDGHGAMLRASLDGAGVDITGLRTVDAPTGNAIIMVTPDGENSIIVSPAANRSVSVEMVDELEGVWSGADVLVVQLEIPTETIAYLVPRAHQAGSRVLVNAAPAAELPPDVLAVCDPLVVNESEAAFLLGGAAGSRSGRDDSPAAVVTGLLGLGPRSVVLTLGGDGAVLAARGDDARPVHVPARAVTPVDTTGAGDAFVGALAVELSRHATLAAAVRRAARVAAVAVTRRGAQASFPTLEEIER